MRRMRRRRPKVVWLPNTGTVIDNTNLAASLQSSAIIFTTSVSFSAGSPTTVVEIPMVLDNPNSAAENAAALQLAAVQKKALDDETAMGYRLRRIVGSIYVSCISNNALAGSSPAVVLVQAGIIVRRVDEDGQALAFSVGANEVDPGNIQNNSDPWIWRKDWVFSPIRRVLVAGDDTLLPTPDLTDEFIEFAGVFPNNNEAVTGPNGTATIDQKTARKVGPEERLFLDLAVTTASLSIPQLSVCQLAIIMPYRVLATPFVAGGNRRNASR